MWNSAGSGWRLQIDIEQGDDRLEALRVDHRPLLERKGRSVEDERKMRRASERGPILELDRDRIALLGDVQEPACRGPSRCGRRAET